MADDLTNSGGHDRTRININEDHEIRYWTKALDVDEETLRRAVAEVGTSAEAVRANLGKA